MTIERKRPLPIGRYWADIFDRERPAFEAWLNVNASRAKVVASEFKEGAGGAPNHDWVLFETTAETLWPDDVLGFAPNRAEPGTNTSDDTAQKPPPEPGALDQAAAALSRIQQAAFLALGGLAVVGVAVLVLVATRKRR